MAGPRSFTPENLPPPPGHVPPPPGYDYRTPEAPKSKTKFVVAGGIAAALVAAGALAFVLKGGSAAPGEPAASPSGDALAVAKIAAPIADYGSPDAATPGLPGTFYDLQKGPDGKNSDLPRGIASGKAFAEEFLKGGLTDDALKARFWAAPVTLRSARFIFTARPPKEIQEVFGVTEHATHNSAWAVVYRGRVKAPFTGEFRFVGFGSDDLAVRFAGAPALEAWHARVQPGSEIPFEEIFRFGKPKKDGTYLGDPVRAGLWIPVEEGKVYDVEIAMIHAQPYSGSKFFLLYERKGETHPADVEGYRNYTRFRVADDPGPPVAEDPQALPPSTPGPVFPLVR